MRLVKSDQWREGKVAYDRGEPFQSNPYDLDTSENRDWFEGWKYGMERSYSLKSFT